MFEKSILEDSSMIQGPLQGVIFSTQGQGLIFWETESLGVFSLQGRYLNGHQATGSWSAGLARPANLHFKHGTSPDGRSLLVWSDYANNDTGAGNPKALSSLMLSSGNPSSTIDPLGFYQVLDLALDQNGHGFLMVSNESQLQSALSENQTSVLLLQVKNWVVLTENPRPLKTVPFHLGGQDVFLGGALDISGKGMLLWRDRELKVYAQQLTDFQVSGSPQTLSLFSGETPRTAITLRLQSGNGYVAWPSSDNKGVVFAQVKNALIQQDTRQTLAFPTQEIYASTNHPSVRAWDFQMNAAGDGVAAWTTTNHQQAFYQGIKQFAFVGSPKKIFQHTNSVLVGMLRVSDNSEGQKILAGIETLCQAGTANNICLSRLEEKKTVWAGRALEVP